MSANTATSTIPENPVRFNAARIAPGETPSPNCPINAGAISAYTCFSGASSTSRTAFKSANFSGKTVSQTGITRSAFSSPAKNRQSIWSYRISSFLCFSVLFSLFKISSCNPRMLSILHTCLFFLGCPYILLFILRAHFCCSLMHKRRSHPFLPDDFFFCPGSQNSRFSNHTDRCDT